MKLKIDCSLLEKFSTPPPPAQLHLLGGVSYLMPQVSMEWNYKRSLGAQWRSLQSTEPLSVSFVPYRGTTPEVSLHEKHTEKRRAGDNADGSLCFLRKRWFFFFCWGIDHCGFFFLLLRMAAAWRQGSLVRVSASVNCSTGTCVSFGLALVLRIWTQQQTERTGTIIFKGYICQQIR